MNNVYAEYDVRNNVIGNPGKYEGEYAYVPHFWESCSEVDILPIGDYDVYVYEASYEDAMDFPDLLFEGQLIGLHEDDQGFVSKVNIASVYTR